MLVGTALTAAAFDLVIMPMNFVAAGVTGLSKMLTAFIPVPLSAMVLAINLLLLVLGLVFMGKAFVMKTVSVSLLFPVFLELFSAYPLRSLAQDSLLAVILAGALLGTGAGLIIRSGASSGGFDILAIILHKKLDVPASTVMNLIDAAIIILQAANKPLPDTLYGILVITLSAALVGRVVTLGMGECQVMIFSGAYEDIRLKLLTELDVGVTLLSGEAGLRRSSMKVVLTLVPMQKIPSLKVLINEVDPSAFVIVDEVRSVLGQGYTLARIKESI